MSEEFTEQQLDAYRRYEKVRQSGKYSMFAPRARQLTGLDEDEYVFVIEHFAKLRAAIEFKSQSN